MKKIQGMEFGAKLVDVLGLPKTTKGFVLRCYIDEAVSIKCEYYPELEDDDYTVFKNYELVEKEE